MKILYCYQYGILGGVCTQLLHRLAQFRATGAVEAHLTFAKDYGISNTLRDYPWITFQDPRKIKCLIKEHQYDLVTVIDSPRYLSAMDEQWVPTPRVIEVHTTTNRGLVYLDQEPWKANAFIVPSRYSANLLCENFRIDSEEIRIVPNAVDGDQFHPVEVESTPPRPIVLWVGKLDAHKNPRGFLAIAHELIKNGVDADFWLVGGQTASKETIDELVDEIELRGLHQRCRWFDRVEHHSMPRLFSIVRNSGGCLVSTSIDESFGMSILESMLSGCPVVAADVGALAELAPQKPYLSLYSLHNISEAHQSIKNILTPKTYRTVANQLDQDRDYLIQTYHPKTVTDHYIRTVQEILTTTKKRVA